MSAKSLKIAIIFSFLSNLIYAQQREDRGYVLDLDKRSFFMRDSGDSRLFFKPLVRGLLDVQYKEDASLYSDFDIHFYDLTIGFDVDYKSIRARTQISFENKKALLSDVYVEYQSERHGVRVGNFYEHFSMCNLNQIEDISFKDNPISLSNYYESRHLAATYFFRAKSFNTWLSIFSSLDPNMKNTPEQGGGVALRVVERLMDRGDNLIHIGLAGRYFVFQNRSSNNSSWRYDIDQGVEIGSTAEFLWRGKRHKLESAYFFAGLDDKNYNNKRKIYKGYYLQASFLIFGNGYGYNYIDGVCGAARGRSCEIAVKYDGYEEFKNIATTGKLYNEYHSLAVSSSYYLNKYIAVKFQYTRVLKANKDEFNLRAQFNF